MSRSGYSEDYDDNWQLIMWRGAVSSATRGARGQAFLRELLAALDAMPDKALVANELQDDGGNVCTLRAIGKARAVTMSALDPEDYDAVSGTFHIAPALVREIVYMNDEGSWNNETPEQRFTRMRGWVASQIKPDPAPPELIQTVTRKMP